MRTKKFWFVTGLFVCAVVVAFFGGVKRGKSVGYQTASGLLRMSGLAAGLDTLQRIRAGDYTNAMERLEAFCYSTAVDLLEQPKTQNDAVVSLLKSDLIQYRETYGHPFQGRYATERRLVELLQANNTRALGVTNR